MDTGSKNGGNPVESGEYLTPKEAAELLKVSRRTIYTWCHTGKIQARLFGASWRILRAPLMEREV